MFFSNPISVGTHPEIFGGMAIVGAGQRSNPGRRALLFHDRVQHHEHTSYGRLA